MFNDGEAYDYEIEIVGAIGAVKSRASQREQRVILRSETSNSLQVLLQT